MNESTREANHEDRQRGPSLVHVNASDDLARDAHDTRSSLTH